MILETGVVVAVESDGLWVETIQKSACEKFYIKCFEVILIDSN